VSVPLSLTVNGKSERQDVDPRTLLVDFIRNDLALTGTHVPQENIGLMVLAPAGAGRYD